MNPAAPHDGDRGAPGDLGGECNPVTTYLKEIGAFRLLTPEEEVALTLDIHLTLPIGAFSVAISHENRMSQE